MPAPVTSAVFSPDGARVVTASDDKTARVWDARTGAPVGAPLQHAGAVTSAVFSPDGTRVVTASERQDRARVGRADRGAGGRAPAACRRRDVGGLQPGRGARGDGVRDKTARVWDARTGAPVGAPLAACRRRDVGGLQPGRGARGDGVSDKTARVWDARTGAPVGAPLQHADAVRSAVFSPDGARVVTASVDKTARVWDARTGAPVGAPLQHADVVWSAVFSPDGARVVTASWDTTARVWDARMVVNRCRNDLIDLAELIAESKMRGLRDFVPGVVDRNRRLQAWRERADGWVNAADGSFEQWVHWYFSDPTTRPDQPGLWRSAAPVDR